MAWCHPNGRVERSVEDGLTTGRCLGIRQKLGMVRKIFQSVLRFTRLSALGKQGHVPRRLERTWLGLRVRPIKRTWHASPKLFPIARRPFCLDRRVYMRMSDYSDEPLFKRPLKSRIEESVGRDSARALPLLFQEERLACTVPEK